MYARVTGCRYIKTSKAERAVLLEMNDLSALRRGRVRLWIPIKCIKGGWSAVDALAAIDEPPEIMVSWLCMKMGVPQGG